MLELLKMEHIQKSFFGVRVLDDVSLTIGQGEIHALLGENGAGKSTLMNILSGVYSKDSGRVIFEEKELPDGSIAAAEQAGIAFVHQELNIFNDLRVYENLFLGKEYTGFLGKLEKQKMIQETEELLDEMGVNIDATELAGHLDTGKKQLLEIAKALHSKAKLIILDEPTTALNNDEIQHLFELVRNLREKGTSFIFISHKMPEIFALADHYTVLRNARYIASGLISETTPEEVTSYMVGESFSTQDVYEKRKLGDVILKVDHISKRQAAAEFIVVKLNSMVEGMIGKENRKFVPYLITVLLYIGVSNVIGLFGLKPPTKDLNVTAALSIMSIILIEAAGFQKR